MSNLLSLVEGWPALMSTEMAARYISVGEDVFLQLASNLDLPCVEIEGLSARWRKQDLDRLIKKLPTTSARHLSDPGKRFFRLDQSQVEAIADAVARQLDRHGTKTESKLVSIGEAIGFLGVGRSTIYKMISEGTLQTRRIGRRTLIPRTELDAILNAPEQS